MNVSRSATAYSLMIEAYKRNDAKAIEYALMINENGTDYQLYNQISDSFVLLGKEIEIHLYELYIHLVNVLECIEQKKTYELTAKTALIESDNTEAVRKLIEEVLQTELSYQCTSFEIDLFNSLVVQAIYIKDYELLNSLILRINQLGDKL